MQDFSHLIAGVRQAHGILARDGVVVDTLLRDPIARSWQRSLGARLDYRQPDDAPVVPRSDLADIVERENALLVCAEPFMESLYEEIRNTSSLVLLTDSSGMILRSTIDPGFSKTAASLGVMHGAVWREDCRGTNAMGVVLADKVPAEVLGPEHFIEWNRVFSCAAAPIFDPAGNLRAVLDASTDFHAGKAHSLALVRLFAKAIENQLFQASFPECLRLHFHARPQFIGTPWEGLALVAPDGSVPAVNFSGREFVTSKGVGTNFSDEMFGVSYDTLIDHARQRLSPLIKLRSASGTTLYAAVEWGRAQVICAGPSSNVGRRAGRSVPTVDKLAVWEELDSGDATMRAAIDQVRRVLGRDISVLIHGETGTGKELLARAMHIAGPRCNGPFVAVNCASIPEGLIESELFGYAEGAFTGARRRGAVGKVLQASSGTLFLDEIGDMPENMQSRLLRVLQEREVVPLGAAQPQRVDMRLPLKTGVLNPC